MTILEELRARDLLNNITNEEKFAKIEKGAGIYIGFDPTATSLHLGNYIQIANLKRFEQHGYKPIALLGGATGMIGDPSGKNAERNLLSEDVVLDNKAKIKKQLESFGLEVIDNFDFYKDMNVLDFLKNVGKLLNINYMIAKDIVKSRLETGISFTEFSYQLIQGNDFKKLYDDHNIKIQMGGSDQWGNITAGVEIIRKTNGDDSLAVGLTANLLTTADGKKFGKSEGNAFFLDSSLTSPFEIYQYLISSTDEDVEKLLKQLTFLSIDEIKEIMTEHSKDKKLRVAQKTLAKQILVDIHGEEVYEQVIHLVSALYEKKDISILKAVHLEQLVGTLPTFEKVSGKLIDVLVEISAASSKREAREFLSSGAIEVNGTKVDDENFEVTPGFDGKFTFIKRGKKKQFLIKY